MPTSFPNKPVQSLLKFAGVIIVFCICNSAYGGLLHIPTGPSLMIQDTIPQQVIASQVDAEPVVGIEAYFKYLDKNYKVPKEARRARKSGLVFIDFAVEADGSIVDIKIHEDLGNGTGEEGVRVIKAGPKWKPAQLNGAPVRTVMRIPIRVVTPPSLKAVHKAEQTSDAIRKMTR